MAVAIIGGIFAVVIIFAILYCCVPWKRICRCNRDKNTVDEPELPMKTPKVNAYDETKAIVEG